MLNFKHSGRSGTVSGVLGQASLQGWESGLGENPEEEKGCSHLPLILIPLHPPGVGRLSSGQGCAWGQVSLSPASPPALQQGLCPLQGFYCCLLTLGGLAPFDKASLRQEIPGSDACP